MLGNNAEFFDDVRRSLLADRRFVDGGDVIHCDGIVAPLTNIYAADVSPIEWQGMDVPAGMPDPRSMTSLILECRSPEWVAEVGQLLARDLGKGIWFVDASDTVWPADQVEATKVTLA